MICVAVVCVGFALVLPSLSVFVLVQRQPLPLVRVACRHVEPLGDHWVGLLSFCLALLVVPRALCAACLALSVCVVWPCVVWPC